MSQSSAVAYISLDPVRREINIYPKSISQRIEAKYQEYLNNLSRIQHDVCILGKDFFNATIHFRLNFMYQTTPGFSLGRAGFKQPGYRSVKRIVLDTDKEYTVYGKRINGEWRILNTLYQSHEQIFTGTIPDSEIINTDNLENLILTNWDPVMFDQEEDKDVIVWQWCRGIKEEHPNLLGLDESYWTPYFYEQNKKIEDGFNEGNNCVSITIPNTNENYLIYLNNGAYGYQKHEIYNKRREIKRSIMKISVLKEKLKNLNKLLEHEKLMELIDNDLDVPNEFLCPISQSIINNPVKTIDNMVYDRSFIERWFIDHNTSPLTGLVLSDKKLVDFIELKMQIDKYIAGKKALLNVEE
tara:strand:- start:273 stop:1337 length:1065 start_codon:yes stop_codon:yes gene_type:complete